MTAVLPLPFAALAMIAQRKPNQDKGFEELSGSGGRYRGKPFFFLFPDLNRRLKPSMDGA
jgi:hypothetical protein